MRRRPIIKPAAAQRHAEITDVLAADVGLRIREARQARGLSLAQLGGDDLSRSFLSLVETGRSRISLRALAIVANRLELPVSHFLRDSESAAAPASALLLAEAEVALGSHQPEECLRLLDEAELTSPRTRDVTARLLRGSALLELHREREAIALLQEGLPEMADTDDAYVRAQYRYMLAKSLYATGNYDEAMILLRQALEDAAVDPTDPVLAGKITVGIGHILFVQREVDRAVEYYQRAIDHFGAVRDFRTQGTIYSGLSLACKRKGDAERALHYARLAASMFGASNDVRSMAAELNNVAVALEERGDLDEALSAARQALTRAQQVEAEDVEALIHSTLASIHVDRRELDEAESEAELAEVMSSDDGALSVTDSRRALARIAEHRGDLERADELYRDVLERLKASGQTTHFADTAIEYSKLLNKRGQLDRAYEYALEAAQLRTSYSA